MTGPHKLTVLCFAVAALAAVLFVYRPSVQAQGQPAWDWPEKAENLKVLPADTPPEKLRAIMVGFSRSLGVRCSHCHVGQEGQPLATYDFASDDNNKKIIARAMYEMLGDINEDLADMPLEGDERANMWCQTCHRGRPVPMQLAEEIGLVYRQAGADSALRHYHFLRAQFHGRGAYDFGEGSLREVGSSLLEKDSQAAVRVFQLNLEHYPESSQAHLDLARAYRAAGQNDRAVQSARRALELNPDNRSAQQLLNELEGKK